MKNTIAKLARRGKTSSGSVEVQLFTGQRKKSSEEIQKDEEVNAGSHGVGRSSFPGGVRASRRAGGPGRNVRASPHGGSTHSGA